MKNIITAIIFFTVTVISAQNKSNFRLEGKTEGIENGTVLRLSDPLSDVIIDSVKVINNRFVLTTKLPSYPYRVILFKDSTTARPIWLENNKMTFDARINKFENAVVTGSDTDKLAMQLRHKAKAVKAYEEIVAIEMNFIETHPVSILSTHNLSVMKAVFGKAKTKALFDKMPLKNQQSEYGKIISDYLNLDIPEALEIGNRYHDFSMPDQDGQPHKLSEFEGKIVLLEFWASWCMPCRQGNPELVKTYEKFSQSGFEIVAVSLDKNKASWLEAIRKDNLAWKHLSDLKGSNNEAALLYGVQAIPDNILIDKNGLIVGRNLKGEKLNAKLAEVLSGSDTDIKFKPEKSFTWQDENGKVLSKTEADAMLKSNGYTPHVNTDKKLIILKKD